MRRIIRPVATCAKKIRVLVLSDGCEQNSTRENPEILEMPARSCHAV